MKVCVCVCVCVCASVVTAARRQAGCAVRAAWVAPTSAVSRAVAQDGSSRPTCTAKDTSTPAGTATAPDTSGQL